VRGISTIVDWWARQQDRLASRPDVFDVSLCVAPPSDDREPAALARLLGRPLPPLLRSIYVSGAASATFDWSMRPDVASELGYDSATYLPAGHIDLLPPHAVAHEITELRDKYGQDAASLIPFAGVESSGDRVAIDLSAGGSIIELLDGDSIDRTPLARSLDDFLTIWGNVGYATPIPRNVGELRNLLPIVHFLGGGALVPLEPGPTPAPSAPWSERHSLEERVEDLFDAISNGDVPAVVAYLDEGIDIEINDYAGRTPLHEAALHGQQAVISMLRRRGARLDTVGGHGFTLLHTAAAGQCDALVTELLTRGADAQARDDFGRTPLHYAKNAETARLLLAAGAEPTLPDSTDNAFTPRALAAKRGWDEVVAVLDAAGS